MGGEPLTPAPLPRRWCALDALYDDGAVRITPEAVITRNHLVPITRIDTVSVHPLPKRRPWWEGLAVLAGVGWLGSVPTSLAENVAVGLVVGLLGLLALAFALRTERAFRRAPRPAAVTLHQAAGPFTIRCPSEAVAAQVAQAVRQALAAAAR
ncbi:MAG: DUF6232 family protein [Actinomycetia bacterium]|nr:DUF6232 family protein [Actinomycetes bacterium]